MSGTVAMLLPSSAQSALLLEIPVTASSIAHCAALSIALREQF
jgi:hypothetical protein